MYPMDFEEFLWANQDTVTAPAIREAFAAERPWEKQFIVK